MPARPARALAAFALALGLLAAAPGMVRAEGIPGCPTATLKSAQALAERAAAHLARVGADAALPRFMDPKGGYMQGDLYVWVFDLDGVMVANGRYPHLVGSRLGPMDGDGLGNAIVARALKETRGWVEYRWYSPCTDRIGPKVAWFVRVGRFVVGVGAYPRAGV